jgi:hypothetical protein
LTRELSALSSSMAARKLIHRLAKLRTDDEGNVTCLKHIAGI